LDHTARRRNAVQRLGERPLKGRTNQNDRGARIRKTTRNIPSQRLKEGTRAVGKRVPYCGKRPIEGKEARKAFKDYTGRIAMAPGRAHKKKGKKKHVVEGLRRDA